MHLFIGQIQGETVFLPPSESYHLHNVLRLKNGDSVQFIDGKGIKGTAKITRSHKAESVLQIENLEEKQKKDYSVHVAMAPTKQNDRTEWFLEKATEIGLSSFIPFTSYHSERRSYKKDRAERIVTSAVKQSLKSYLPEVEELVKLNDVIERFKDFKGQKFIAHCCTSINRISIEKVIQPKKEYLFLIGPEGDFSTEEIQEAINTGFISVSFGDERLRTETAALYAAFSASFINK